MERQRFQLASVEPGARAPPTTLARGPGPGFAIAWKVWKLAIDQRDSQNSVAPDSMLQGRDVSRGVFQFHFRTSNWHCHMELTHFVSPEFRASTTSVAFRTLGVFSRPRLGVGLSLWCLKSGFSQPFGADVDGCSAVRHHQSDFVTFATTLAQSYIYDCVVNREHKLFCCVDIHACTVHLVYCFVLVAS